MHQALRVLNELVEDGVIPLYAIGGAIAASFYIEAQATADLDVFVVLPKAAAGLSLLTPVYAACKAKGGVVEGEHIHFGSWPVQILDPYKPLIEEAMASAVEVDFDGIPTRVMTAEHLCAICLDTKRTKDIFRVSVFIEQAAVDVEALKGILQRYNLQDRAALVPNWPEQVIHGNRPNPA